MSKKTGILVADIGGKNLKIRHSDHDERRKTASGAKFTPQEAVKAIRDLAGDWSYDRLSLGCPGPVKHNRLLLDPFNLGPGWLDFDFDAAFDCEVRLVNDAVMQAIGSYDGGKMLFIGLGTGLGAALVVEDMALPLEVAHLPYAGDYTYEDCIGRRGLDRLGRKAWEGTVHDVVERLRLALVAEYVVIGGGNGKRLKTLPKESRLGDNLNAFEGGFRMWREHFRSP
ncbi:MAG: ROK family protein [Geminicoccaceae bacterium]|nr:ROK family protein [Geminicoccaceae bacterium]MCB9945617.1 ROK family protein [Geminicoccaceae bacterium]